MQKIHVVKRIGIWMDHSSAHLMAFTVDPIETTVVESKFTHADKVESIAKSESLMHNKEQGEQAEYYHDLGDIIKNYGHVLLFGPTDAKVELNNMLQDDHHFDDIRIDVVPADKMSEPQKHVFVKEYFLKHQ